MTTGIKRKRIGFYSVKQSNQVKPKQAVPEQTTARQKRNENLMTTDEYIEYLKRDVQKLEIKSMASEDPEKRKALEARKAKRADLLQAIMQWFGTKGRIEAKAFSADGSPIEPDIIH